MTDHGSRPKSGRVALAQQLFEQFYLQCFWHFPPDFQVQAGDIPAIIKGLSTYGGHKGFFAAAPLCR
jgi:hypothetical protein